MRQFQLLPTTVTPKDPADAVLVFGDQHAALHANTTFDVNEIIGARIGPRAGEFSCYRGRIQWTPFRQCAVDIDRESLLYDAKGKLVGTAKPMPVGYVAVHLYETYAVKLENTGREMLCPQCGHLENFRPEINPVVCGYCWHRIDRNWITYLIHFHFKGPKLRGRVTPLCMLPRSLLDLND